MSFYGLDQELCGGWRWEQTTYVCNEWLIWMHKKYIWISQHYFLMKTYFNLLTFLSVLLVCLDQVNYTSFFLQSFFLFTVLHSLCFHVLSESLCLLCCCRQDFSLLNRTLQNVGTGQSSAKYTLFHLVSTHQILPLIKSVKVNVIRHMHPKV